jgi:Pro-kumamolisin, activation domain/Subtilase family
MAVALVLLALPAPFSEATTPLNSSPSLGDFVLYAERSVSVGAFDDVDGGDIGVVATAQPGFGIQLVVGDHTNVDPSRDLLSPSTSLGYDASVGDVQTTTLQNNGAKLGTVAPFPSALPPIPLALMPGAAGSDVNVASHQSVTLLPGTYGALTIADHCNVTLGPGTYSFSNVTISDHANLVADPAGVSIQIAGALTTAGWDTISPAAGQTADKLTILVAGSDGTNGSSQAASIGQHSQIDTLLATPNGSLSLGPYVQAAGAFAGFDIAVADHVQVKFESGFSAGGAGQQGSQQLVGYYGNPSDPSVGPLVGPVPPDTNIALAVGLPVRNPQGLHDFIQQVSDPKNPNFRKYLTQTQFYATYGATNSDYQSLMNWAKSAGFRINATYPNNLLVSVTGTAAQIERALFVNLDYRLRQDGSKFVAVDRDPSLNLTVPILHISGLTDFVLPKQGVVLNGTGIGKIYRAADLRNAYLGVGSTCQNLDGTGQIVGIVDFDVFADSDISGYDVLQIPPRNPGNVGIVATEGGNPTAGSNFETTIDIEMVQAMAPNAQILLFQGSTGITGHLDDILNAMATFSPRLTVASCSLGFGRSDNSQQALDEMAAQGTSFFTASGDFGDIGDPQGNLDMGNQTLVGGTFLSTNPLTAPLPSPVYPTNYYAGDTTWNAGRSLLSKDVTGGGIMDGKNKNGDCFCWPYSICCGSGVAIPDYQAGVDMSTNGGSTQWRNYPDVALTADDVEIFFEGSKGIVSGTSVAAPLWAGFMALVNQRSQQNGAGPAGFVNPTLYDIGLTRGAATDLYSTCFNDVQDGASNFNGFGSGFTSVPGYDLTTGWGTPTCQLINQIGSVTPLTPNTPLDLVEFVITTGGDNLRGNGGFGSGCSGTGATADVLLQDGSSFQCTLKDTGTDEEFANGSVHTIDCTVPNSVSPPLTQSHGIAGVTINIKEDYGFPCTADNWDVNDLSVSLFNPPSPPNSKVCQLNLTGGSTLQDGSTGLVRFSESAGSSGVGPSATFLTSSGSGCP